MGNLTQEKIKGMEQTSYDISKRHQQLISNLLSRFAHHLHTNKQLKNSGYQALTGMMVHCQEDRLCPDLLISQTDEDSNDNIAIDPIFIVEILSSRTRDTDLQYKKSCYINLNNLQEYMVVEQDLKRIIVFHYNNNWEGIIYKTQDTIHLTSIDYKIAVKDIYRHIILPKVSAVTLQTAKKSGQISGVSFIVNHILKGIIITIIIILGVVIYHFIQR